jgi:hypothetical protein
MKRREFITLISSATVAWPFPARTQQAIPVIDVLGSASAAAYSERSSLICKILRKLVL